MKRTIMILLSLMIVISASSESFAAKGESNESMKKEVEIVFINDETLNLNAEDERIVQIYNDGLIEAIRKSGFDDKKTIEEKEKAIDDAIQKYSAAHCDPISSAIYEKAFSQSHAKNISIVIDNQSIPYKKHSYKYVIDDTLIVCIDPEYVYIDISTGNYTQSNYNGGLETATKGWNYVNAFARRSLYKKVTVKGSTYNLKLYSVHTGGRVKYNGTKATHSSSYQAYAQNEIGGNLTFTQTVKLKEPYDDTGYHYKYMGKVSGSVTLTSPVSVTFTLPEKTLGCEARVTRNGTVTKKYWPSL